MSVKFEIESIDGNSRHAKTVYYVADGETDPEGTAETALLDAQEGLTATGITAVTLLPFDASSLGTQTDGPYNRIADKAVFLFADENGTEHKYELPGPKEDIFLSDGKTIDSTNTDVIAFVAAVLDTCKTTNGDDLTSFIRGYRDFARKRKNP